MFGIQYENNIDITLVISFLLINVFPRSWTSLVCHGLLVSRAQEAQNRREREYSWQQKMQLEEIRRVNGLPVWR